MRLHNYFDDKSFPESGYKGSYIIDIANQVDSSLKIESSKIDNLISDLPEDPEEQIDALIKVFQQEDKSLWKQIKEISLKMVLKTIEDDLKAFKVDFDNWYYESSLGSLEDPSSKIASAINQLKTEGLAYEENGAIWLKTEQAGDDKNRVLIRDDGRATYFAADLAYHKDKVLSLIHI